MSPNKTHTCYSSRYYHAEFNYDGKVYRCTARDYSDKYVVGELQESGRIRWNDKYFEKVFSKTAVENEVCIHCIHMPICGGPCAQKRFENDDINKNCLLTGTNMTIENFIINRYEEMHKTR